MVTLKVINSVEGSLMTTEKYEDYITNKQMQAIADDIVDLYKENNVDVQVTIERD